MRELAAVVPGAGAAPRRAVADAAAGVRAASWRVTFAPSAALLARGVNVDSVRARLREAGTIVDATPKVTPDGIAFEFLVAGDDRRRDGGALGGRRHRAGEPIAPAAPAASPPTPADAGRTGERGRARRRVRTWSASI